MLQENINQFNIDFIKLKNIIRIIPRLIKVSTTKRMIQNANEYEHSINEEHINGNINGLSSYFNNIFKILFYHFIFIIIIYIF